MDNRIVDNKQLQQYGWRMVKEGQYVYNSNVGIDRVSAVIEIKDNQAVCGIRMYGLVNHVLTDLGYFNVTWPLQEKELIKLTDIVKWVVQEHKMYRDACVIRESDYNKLL